MSKEPIKFVSGAVLVRDVVVPRPNGDNSPMDLIVAYGNDGVIIRTRHSFSDDALSALFGRVLRLLNGGPLVFENPDCTKESDCPTDTFQQQRFSVKQEIAVADPEKVLNAVALDSRAAATDKQLEPLFQAQEQAKQETVAAGTRLDTPALELREPGNFVAVDWLVRLLTVPPLDEQASLLGARVRGRFEDSVLTRLWFGFPVALEQRLAAQQAGTSFDYASWKPRSAESVINITDPVRAVEDIVSVCKAVHEHARGKVSEIDMRMLGGEGVLRESVAAKIKAMIKPAAAK